MFLLKHGNSINCKKKKKSNFRVFLAIANKKGLFGGEGIPNEKCGIIWDYHVFFRERLVFGIVHCMVTMKQMQALWEFPLLSYPFVCWEKNSTASYNH